MFLMKLLLHISAWLQMIVYKLIYGKRLVVGSKTTWRKRMNIMIANEGKLHIGENCFFNNDCSVSVLQRVSIGDRCLFGERVSIYDHNHCFKERKPIKSQGYSAGDVVIGDDCWIGSNVVILKGVHIGNRVVIGAGCVIDTEIPDDTIVKRDNHLIFEKIRFKE